MDSRGARIPDYGAEEPYHLSQRFVDDLEIYRRKLSEAGCSQDCIAKSLRAVRHTWMLVYECRGNVTPDDLDEDIITELECLMRELTLEFSHWKLRCFG